MKILDGRLALVTGGGRGNGAAIAKGLANYGADVIVTDIDGDTAAETAKAIKDGGGNAWSFVMDVADLGMCRAVAAQIEQDVGPVAVLINNAGIIRRTGLDDADAREAWDDCMSINATGVFNVSMAFLPHLRRTKGNIVNMTSITGFVSARTFPGYAASKAAVISMTKGFAAKLAPDGTSTGSCSAASASPKRSSVLSRSSLPTWRASSRARPWWWTAGYWRNSGATLQNGDRIHR